MKRSSCKTQFDDIMNGGGREGNGMQKGITVYFVCTQTPLKKCKHLVV